MSKWKKLIEKKKDEIIETIEKADKEALKNNKLRYVVYLWDDGEIEILEDIAGGNTQYMGIREDKCIEISEHCYTCNIWELLQYTTEEIVEEIKTTMKENEKEELRTWTEEYEKDYGQKPDEYEEYYWLKYTDAYDRAEEDAIDEASTWSWEKAEAIIKERLKDMLEDLK